MSKKLVPKVCPTCELEFTLSTATDEKKYCSQACENGKPLAVKKKKQNYY